MAIMSFANSVIYSVLIFLLTLPACRSNFECIHEELTLSIIDAVSSENVTSCIDRTGASKIINLFIQSPFLTELKAGSLTSLNSTYRLNITAENLRILHPQALDCQFNLSYQLHYLYIKSNVITKLNEQQFKGCLNIRQVSLDGGELQYISFNFTEGSNIRELYVRNMPKLKSIGKVLGNIMGMYVIENTGLEQLEPNMFEHNTVAVQNADFRNSPNLEVIPKMFLFGGYEYYKVNFDQTPIEIVEEGFLAADAGVKLAQIKLGGNKIRYLNQTVFEEVFESWDEMSADPSQVYISWNYGDDKNSLPLVCDCSINWLSIDSSLMKYLKKAFCESGAPVENLALSDFFHCFDCPIPNGDFPAPEGCRYYYHCYSGHPYLQKCPKGSYFNPKTESCEEDMTLCY